MSKLFYFILPIICCLLLPACSLPDQAPPTVTNPAIRSLYAKALKGDGDALYKVSQMYKNGTYGFPRSSYYSSIAHSEAADHGNATAIYENFMHKVATKRNKLTASYARTATFKEWEALGDELSSLLHKADRVGYADAVAEIDDVIHRYRELSHSVRFHYHKCRYCNGEGKVQTYGAGLVPCPDCDERGYIEF